jgi:hypothetical protein
MEAREPEPGWMPVGLRRDSCLRFRSEYFLRSTSGVPPIYPRDEVIYVSARSQYYLLP